LEQSRDKHDGTTLPSEPQLQGDSDDTPAVVNASFSVDELTARLRKSLTLDDQPQLESFAAEVQSAAEADSQSNCADIAAEAHPLDESSTFFDCENKSFDEKVVVGPAQDIADNILPVQCEVDDTASVEVDENMADHVDQPRSPPIAITKGSYNINWDEFDENSDPVTLQKGLSISPPKSPVVPACVGAGDGIPVAENDPFKPGRRLTNSPPGTVAASTSSPTKQKERRSINNNLPEPVTDAIVSNPVDIVAQSDATDGVSIVSGKETPSENVGDDEQPEDSEASATTECLHTDK